MLPDSVLVGPTTYPVSTTSLPKGTLGSMDEYPPVIRLSAALVSDADRLATLIHEVVHAVSYVYGLELDEKQTALAEAIIMRFVLDNPVEEWVKAVRPA